MRFRSSLRRAGIVAGCLSAIALVLDPAAAAPKVSPGALVEILDQENRVVRSSCARCSRRTTTRPPCASPSSRRDLRGDDALHGAAQRPGHGRLREWHLAIDGPVRVSITGADGEVNLRAGGDGRGRGSASNWYWVGERLAGVVRPAKARGPSASVFDRAARREGRALPRGALRNPPVDGAGRRARRRPASRA